MLVVCPRDCYDTCTIEVEIAEGKLVKASGYSKHPLTCGFICSRGLGDPKRTYVNRVLYPHVRVGSKINGYFKRFSWGEALDLIASKIRETMEDYGPEYILHVEYAGNMGLITWYYTRRFWNLIGATSTDYSICSKTGHEAISLHYGSSYGVLPEEYYNMKLIVFWGSNIAVSGVHLWRIALQAKVKNEAVIACIDPYKSETARASDIYLQVRPGTDVALAYGIANYLIEHGYVDREFLEKHTYGFEFFREEASKWNLEKVEEITGIEREKIVEISEAYGERRPSLTFIGLGLSRSDAGAESVRAVSLIPALLGIHRGFYYSNSMGWYVNLQYLAGAGTSHKTREVSIVKLGELLSRGDFKFVYVYNMNPAETIPGSKKVVEGLLKEDVFVVVHDTHWTTTCKCANVVLPAPTYLEKTDVTISYSHPYVMLSRKVIEPLGESMPEYLVFQEIAKRLNLEEDLIYEDPLKALEKTLENAFENGSFKELLEGKILKLKQKPKDHYPTPTGRIEFYSRKAEILGLNPLPKFDGIGLGDDEFILLNGSHPKYTNSQFREVYGSIPPLVVMNVRDCEKLKIRDGDVIALYNEYGEVHLRVRMSKDVPSKTLWTYKMVVGVNGTSINVIIPPKTQKIGGSPTINSTRVKVKKLEVEVRKASPISGALYLS